MKIGKYLRIFRFQTKSNFQLTDNSYQTIINLVDSRADVAELADAPDLGSGTKVCRFNSCHPHHKLTKEPLCGSFVSYGEICVIAEERLSDYCVIMQISYAILKQELNLHEKNLLSNWNQVLMENAIIPTSIFCLKIYKHNLKNKKKI